MVEIAGARGESAEIDVGMILRAYDYTCPLLLGDVPTPGVRLRVDHRAHLTMALPDGIDMAEVSFNRYALACAQGDDSLVGLPAFVMQGFRHRAFYVPRDSTLASLADLHGRTVGTNAWSETGTLWARAAMRDAGVEIDDVRWVVGALEPGGANGPPPAGDPQPPVGTRFLEGEANLLAELDAGRIDALTTGFAPDAVFVQGSAIRRLVENYPEVESAYRRRTGIYPAFHIVAARRGFAERHPAAVLTVYAALRQSFDQWTAKVRRYGEASPWQQHELETMLRDFGGNVPPFGLEAAPLRRMVEALCAEQRAQGLTPRAAKPEQLFAWFASASGGAQETPR